MREEALATGKANASPQNGAGLLARIGDATRRHRRTVFAVQWIVIVFYAVLVVVPAFLPLPPEDAHIYDNLVLLAQFVFWGIWWPFVILGTMFMGRVWCGMFCPEGALCEFASRCGLGKPVPRWMTWGGWPFVAFLTVTVYGQLVSVYEYSHTTPLPTTCSPGWTGSASLAISGAPRDSSAAGSHCGYGPPKSFCATRKKCGGWPYSFIPMAGLGAFLGLSMLTVTMLTAEGIALPWLAQIRGALVGLATLGSLALTAKMIFTLPEIRFSRRVVAYGCAVTVAAVVPASWILMFYVW